MKASTLSFECSNLNNGFQRVNKIDTPIIESTNTITALQHHLEQRQSLTAETWITPLEVGSFDYLPIIIIGRQNDNNLTIRPRDRCHDHDFRLSQFASYLQLSYTAVGKCQTAIFASSPLDSSLTHVVVSFTNSSTSAYINGESVSTLRVTDFIKPQFDN
jgi:hypothetical protein